MVAAAHEGVAVRAEAAIVPEGTPVKLVPVAVNDQPLVPPRLSDTVMSFNVPAMTAGANGVVMVPKLTVVASLLVFAVPTTGVVAELLLEPVVAAALT